jgi:hypothetical protein
MTMPPTMIDRTPIQIVSLLVAIVIIIIQIMWAIRNKERFYYVVPMISLSLHVVVYYTIVLMHEYTHGNDATLPFFTIWSSVLRLHSLLTILSLEVYRLRKRG